jgi:hypothetical protein
MRPHVNSTAAWAAPQARATSRQCGRHNGNGSRADPYLNKAGMSPEAIRERKPYVVGFVQAVRSGK